MELLLIVVGVVVGAAIGWRLGRSQSVETSVVSHDSVTPDPIPFDAVVGDLRCGVVIVDSGGDVTYRNQSACAMHGTHVGVLLDGAIERHVDAAEGGEPSGEVLELYGPPRTVFAIEARPMPGRGVVVLVEDITEQRLNEQVRTDLVANISHELKSPVGALSVLAETLEDETEPETVRRVVTRMMSEAERAANVIDDLIELSRIELGGEREMQPIRVVDVVRSAVDRVSELAAQRGIGISTLDPVDDDRVRSGSLVVKADQRQLVSAVGNLVENAVKYSEPGGSVQVRARREHDDVEIMVADHGVGIPRRDLDRIFERFYRSDRARSRETGGTGLGLSIVRHVATNHGGGVEVVSTEGEGSTFVLRIPIGDVDEEWPDHDRPAQHVPEQQPQHGEGVT